MNIADIEVGKQYRVTEICMYPKCLRGLGIGEIVTVALIDHDNGDLAVGLKYSSGLFYVNPNALEVV